MQPWRINAVMTKRAMILLLVACSCFTKVRAIPKSQACELLAKVNFTCAGPPKLYSSMIITSSSADSGDLITPETSLESVVIQRKPNNLPKKNCKGPGEGYGLAISPFNISIGFRNRCYLIAYGFPGRCCLCYYRCRTILDRSICEFICNGVRLTINVSKSFGCNIVGTFLTYPWAPWYKPCPLCCA